jgi:hypothetical protein
MTGWNNITLEKTSFSTMTECTLHFEGYLFEFASHTFRVSFISHRQGSTIRFQATYKSGPDEFPESLAMIFLQVTSSRAAVPSIDPVANQS